MLGPQEVARLGGVALLEEVCHCWGTQAMPNVAHGLLLLPWNRDVELSSVSSLASCVPAYHHASHQDNNGLNL